MRSPHHSLWPTAQRRLCHNQQLPTPCRLFPVGCRLAIKEPYFKRYADGTCGLRVDNPSDVVFLPPCGDGPQAALLQEDPGAGSNEPQELSRLGNQLFG